MLQALGPGFATGGGVQLAKGAEMLLHIHGCEKVPAKASGEI